MVAHKTHLQPGVTEGLVDAVPLPHLDLQQVVNQVNRCQREREMKKEEVMSADARR